MARKRKHKSLRGTPDEHDAKVRDYLDRTEKNLRATGDALGRGACMTAFRSYANAAESFGSMWTNYQQSTAMRDSTLGKKVFAAKESFEGLRTSMEVCVRARRR